MQEMCVSFGGSRWHGGGGVRRGRGAGLVWADTAGVDEPHLPLRVRLAMFIALTLVGGGIAVVTDVGHILAFAPSVAFGLTNLVDWLYRRRARRQRIQAPPAATL